MFNFLVKRSLLVILNVLNVYGGNFIDINDILNVNYMPGSLLLLEGNENEYLNSTSGGKRQDQVELSDGSIIGAYNTMGYHRKMINEYLCRSFLADQILSQMSLTRVRRRLGTVPDVRHKVGNDISKNAKPRVESTSVKDTLLSDEGSTNYKHWLTKSTTLEDIYRHYELMQDRDIEDRDPSEDNSADDQDTQYDGELTGYAIPSPHIPQRAHPSKLGNAMFGHSGGGGGGYVHPTYTGGSGHSAYGTSGNAGGYDFQPQHVHYHHGGDYVEHGKGDKELVLADLFEIALTAIAFLSFGCFILQVIMCISMSGNTTTVMPIAMSMMPMAMTMMPMTMNDDGANDDGMDTTGTMGDGVEPVRLDRYKRNTNNNINVAMNELARRVLMSIEAALVVEDDNGNCLRKKLCENNKYSRTLPDNRKIWIPIWSFGMSWLTGRLSSHTPAATSMLDSLKASVLGLGNANCDQIYNKCELTKLRDNRRRRRK